MEYLLKHCKSDSQRTKVKLYIKLNSMRAVASELGINQSNVSKTLRLLKKKAAQAGIAPEADMTHPTAEGFNVKGTSTLYDEDGNVKIQWVKTQNNGYSFEDIAEVYNEALSEFKCVKCKTPIFVNDDLLAVYPLGDPHIGMYSWGKETGDDFDLEIAANDLRKATKSLVDRSLPAKNALILQLGDFYHSDSQDNRTSRSGNALDVDGRWAKVLRVGIDLMIELVCSALEKHETVTIKNIIGNHDDHSSHFLTIALQKYWHNEPRVIVDISPAKFWYYQFGKVLIGSTHGDTAKPEKLPQIMAADRPKEWGDTEYRYWYTGHIHSKNTIEFVGCTWTSFRNLAPNDYWHDSMGYRANKDMNCILIHKEFGEIGRNTASLKMIRS